MTLVGLENIIPYVKGGNTGEVAEELQERYKIFEKFVDDIELELEDKFLFFLERYINDKNPQAFQEACKSASLWLRDRWREYIEAEEHGIKTKASQMRGDPAFIDTASFYKGTFWEIRE